MNSDKLPVIIGVGQLVDHWDGSDADTAPHPLDMIKTAIDSAVADCGGKGLTDAIDFTAFVRTFPDSLRKPVTPFGAIANLPHAVLKRTKLSPREIVYSAIGGEQPQALVNEVSARLSAGDIEVALIAGGETTGALKTALKNKIRLDWSDDTDGQIEDRMDDEQLLSPYEIANGLGMPPQTYAALEQAWRKRMGLSRNDYLSLVGETFAKLSEEAARNPYAQFPTPRDAQFLATPSKENYPICDPLLKWHVAQDAVNQSAALILTTVGKAKELGIDPDKFVFLHGHADVKDSLISQRPDLSRSDAIELALDQALKTSGLEGDDIGHRDIYSCFPIVVMLAAEHLGLNPADVAMSVTGGLPFFGGPGNNYSTHAIAAMVERLRKDRGAYGLVLANGGFITKESAAVYSTKAPENWQAQSSHAAQNKINQRDNMVMLEKDCEAEIEAYCVRHGRHGPEAAYVIARNEEGRIIANVEKDHRATIQALAKSEQPVGQSIRIERRNDRNFLVNPSDLGSASTEGGFLVRDFQYVSVKRIDNILEVTLNRPESYNALMSAAHFELAEIFDAFERDRDLWVAIVTGAGDKAFCSGNDLKVTAKGGDMTMPKSGFAGLCARTNRTKPVIAAVNGIAMGGGLEIILACDLAVAESSARFALPEVKVGLFAAAGGLQQLTRQIGRKAAMDLILTGRTIEAEEAKNLGIINSVAEPGKSALETARALAQSITANSPSSVSASKRVLNAMDEKAEWSEVLALSKVEIAALMKTKDMREGVTAFAQKRKPVWVNK